jgi:hypothetical protein
MRQYCLFERQAAVGMKGTIDLHRDFAAGTGERPMAIVLIGRGMNEAGSVSQLCEVFRRAHARDIVGRGAHHMLDRADAPRNDG